MVRKHLLLFGIMFCLRCIAYKEAVAQVYLQQPVFFCCKELPLGGILDSIGHKLGINFSYDASLIPHHRLKTCCFYGKPLTDALNELMDTLQLGYLERGNQLAIYPINRPGSPASSKEQYLLEIKGWISEAKTKKAIPYASISVENHPIGVISNIDGYFSLRIPTTFADSNIRVSSMGFNDFRFSYSAGDTTARIIVLTPARVSIPEVIIRTGDPLALIRASCQAIPVNYSAHPAYLTAFFRETTWKDKICISISESVLQIYKSSYSNSFDNDQVKLFKGRKKQDSLQLSRLNYKVEGGLFNSLMLDIARNRASFLDPLQMQNYDYVFSGFTKYNDREVYVIQFDQKEGVSDALFKGSVYLDVKSLAIVGAEFALSPRGMRYARQMLVKKSPHRYQVRPIKAEYAVHYRQTGDNWNLSDVRMNLEIKARPRSAMATSVYKTVSEMVITGKDTAGVRRFRYNETSRSSDILVNQIKDFDESFWNGFNVLEPETNLYEPVRKIRTKITPQIPFSW
ncbi:MAG: carboxypeptidase-like regulatory domain-containing protein [Bacteroidales bacterium]